MLTNHNVVSVTFQDKWSCSSFSSVRICCFSQFYVNVNWISLDFRLLGKQKPAISPWQSPFFSLPCALQSLLDKKAISTEPQLIGWHASVSVPVPSHLSQPHHRQTDALVTPWGVNFRKGPRPGCFQLSDESPLIFPNILSAATVTPNTWLLSRRRASKSIIRLAVFLPTLLNWSLVCTTQILEAELAEVSGRRDVVVRKGASSPQIFSLILAVWKEATNRILRVHTITHNHIHKIKHTCPSFPAIDPLMQPLC